MTTLFPPPADALLWLLPLAALYARVPPSRALDHATRRRIHAHLCAAGPASRRELADALRLRATTLLHHLRMLHACGLIAARRAGRETLYAEGRVRDEHGCLRVAARRRIAAAMLGGATTQRAIAAATGLSQRLVAYHLSRMDALVLVAQTRPRSYALREPDLVRARMGIDPSSDGAARP